MRQVSSKYFCNPSYVSLQNNMFENNEDVNHQLICKQIHNDIIRIHDKIIIDIYVKIYVEIITHNINTSYYTSCKLKSIYHIHVIIDNV